MSAEPNAFVPLFKVSSDVELALVRSILEGYEVLHYVHNGHFSFLEPGLRIPLLNERWVCVFREELSEAQDILTAYGFFPFAEQPYQPSAWTKYRHLLELIFFGWIIPGDRRTVQSMSDE